ncbi:MAG: rhomboid family intramembrane serine protease [Oculatellaceae cyanobacterium Prado106]|nr:rhomboid family intramembrane serine protease [Oculatellaceae cyanobacterium Prado106]
MVPLRDNNPIQIRPYVTYALIAISVLVFVYEATLSPGQLEAFLDNYAIVPAQLSATLFQGNGGRGFPEVLTLITSQFLHGGFLHLGGNMLFLWIFGNNIEERLGRVNYLIFYLLCGALAGLAQWYFSMTSSVPSLGASGAIAGVMGAYILRFPNVQVLTLVPLGIFFFTARIPAIFFLGFWFVQQAFYGVASLSAPTNIGMQGGGIAYWAHAGGFVFGAILGPLLGLFRKPTVPGIQRQ